MSERIEDIAIRMVAGRISQMDFFLHGREDALAALGRATGDP